MRLRRRRQTNRYELFTCAWKGHVHVGTDAAEVTGIDFLLVREYEGLRWHRCLRCDGWYPALPPDDPTRPNVPTKDEIEVPARGKVLRDRYVLRLIAFDRAVHVIILVGLALLIFFFAGDRVELQHDYARIMNALDGTSGTTDAGHTFLGKLRRFFLVAPSHLYWTGIVLCAYAALEAAEMVGLWLMKRWAEYLTFVATAVFIPAEIYELVQKISVTKFVILALNLAIALYLLLAKRLFGARGGRRAVEERQRAGSGWPAIEAGMPLTGGQQVISFTD